MEKLRLTLNHKYIYKLYIFHLQLKVEKSLRVTSLFLMFYIFLISGDLLFTLPKKSDTGLYSCEVVNEHGMDMASTKVVIKGII